MSFNLDEEVIDGHLVTVETKKLWAVEMDLAKHLLDVCARHNLKIWATDGTLIGAVRHKGFIPWDDDMDFCMMREDYDKLIEIGPSEFKEPYFFQSFYTDEHSWGAVTKIRRSDTAIIEKGWEYRKEFNRGVFIDILVLDAVPDDNKRFKELYRKISLLRGQLKQYEMWNPKSFSGKERLKLYLYSILFLFINPQRIHSKIEKMLSKNRIDDNEYCAPLDYYSLERRDISKVKKRNKHDYDETIMLPFHDMLMPVPKGYDALLKVLYGDYMKPVKFIQSHGNIVVDTDHSYVEILNDLKKEKSK